MHRLAEDVRRRLGLRPAVGRDRRVEFVDEDRAGMHVLDAREQLAQQPEARRHDAARRARMDAFAQHVDAQRADQVAAQRRRAPELLVVAALGVEADDEARASEPRAERVDVGRQVRAAAFLAGLDQHDAARVRDLLLAQCADRREGREERIAVVRAAAAIELAVAQHRRPGLEAVGPARELRLLVEVPVHQHAVVHVARHVDHEHRRATRDAQHLDLRAGRRLGLGPALHQLHGALHVAVRFPVADRRSATCSGCGRTRPAAAGSSRTRPCRGSLLLLKYPCETSRLVG